MFVSLVPFSLSNKQGLISSFYVDSILTANNSQSFDGKTQQEHFQFPILSLRSLSLSLSLSLSRNTFNFSILQLTHIRTSCFDPWRLGLYAQYWGLHSGQVAAYISPTFGTFCFQLKYCVLLALETFHQVSSP